MDKVCYFLVANVVLYSTTTFSATKSSFAVLVAFSYVPNKVTCKEKGMFHDSSHGRCISDI